jgi:hypothetical protein
MQAFRQAAAAGAAAARGAASSGRGSPSQESAALVHGQPLERVVRTVSPRPPTPESEAGSGPQTTEEWLEDWRTAAAQQAAQMRQQQLQRWGLL